MIGTCANCGKEDEGCTYDFYYGKLLRSDWKPGTDGRVLGTTTRTYQATGSAGAFICDACVTKKRREASDVIAIIGLMFGSLLAALGLLEAESRSAIVCGGAGVLVGLVALVSTLTERKRVAAGKGTIEGEQLAIEACRDDITQRTGATEFWTTARYKSLFDKPQEEKPEIGLTAAENAQAGLHRYHVRLSGPAYDGTPLPLESGMAAVRLDFDFDSPKARAASGQCLLILSVFDLDLDLTLEKSAANTYTLRRSNQMWTATFGSQGVTLRLDDPLSGEHCVTYSFVRG